MNKNITYGLAASTLLLSVALAYSIGSNNTVESSTLTHMANQNVAPTQEWTFSSMGNRMSTTTDRYDTTDNRNASNLSQNESCDTSLLLDEGNLDLSSSDVDQSELEEMLTVLINDEYKARAEYVALVDEFGELRPFTNLINAETNHVEALSQLFDAYDLDIPSDNGEDYAVIPTSLEEAYAIGVDAEIANIALYENYLDLDLPIAVETVFENLMNASEKHLSTFEAYADGDVSTQSMMGSQGMRGRR